LQLNNNLKMAIVFSVILNSALAFSGFYARTYDSYTHMFFADHYRRMWFNAREPKWYMGFSVMSYPPLAHQILALLSYVTGLELAYVTMTILLMILMPLGVYRFSKIFVSEEAAGYASLISVFLPGILLSVYTWGQYPTLFSLVVVLFVVPSFVRYLKVGGLLHLAESICLFEVAISIHFTGMIFAPLLLLVAFLTILVQKESNSRTSLKRFLLFLGLGSFLSMIIVYPVLFGTYGKTVHIPHPSTFNYFLDLDLFTGFFLNMYGFILLLILLTVIMVVRHRRNLPLFTLSLFFLVLGLGGTTPLPQIVFGENWLGLTYGRFNLFAGLAFMPLVGLVCTYLRRKKYGKTFLVAFLVLSILFAGWIGNRSMFRPRPKEVPVEPLVRFLDRDQHWRWRYLTLGFGSYDFGRLSILSNATTLDGYYYRGRNIPALANSGVGYLGAAKFFENGLFTLKAILENATEYNLKFVFCNDRFYEPLLNETGFIHLDEKYGQVTIWGKTGVPMLDIEEITRNINRTPTLSEYLWGILPLFYVISSLLLFIVIDKKERVVR